MIKKFCELQLKCDEDDEYTWTCIADIYSGKNYKCPFDTVEEAVDCVDMRLYNEVEAKRN